MAVAGGYDVRTVPTSYFRYLHLADTAPAPYLGSTRAGVATTDAHDGTWSARTTAGGDLSYTVRRVTPVRLGAHGCGRPTPRPRVVTDAQGRDLGRRRHRRAVASSPCTPPPRSTALLASAHVARRGRRPRRPALAVDGQGRRARSRRLRCRHAARAAHAGRAVRPMEPPAPDGQARVVVDPRRTRRHVRTRTVASGSPRSPVSGAACTSQHTTHAGRRWTGFHPVDHQAWSSHLDARARRRGRRPGLAGHRRRPRRPRRPAHRRPGAGAGDRGRLAGRPVVAVLLAVDDRRPQRPYLARRRRTTDGDLAVSSPGCRRPALDRPRAACRRRARVGDRQRDPDRLGRRRAGRASTDSARTRALAPPARSGRPAPATHGPHGGGFSVSRFL